MNQWVSVFQGVSFQPFHIQFFTPIFSCVRMEIDALKVTDPLTMNKSPFSLRRIVNPSGSFLASPHTGAKRREFPGVCPCHG